ncbi:putative WD repeat-containing protein C3H5.08c [Bienertia sinuspersici]
MDNNVCVENDDFFDAPEEISSESDTTSDSSDDQGSSPELRKIGNNELSSLHYDFWSGNPKSIDERRNEFIRKTGFVLDRCQTAREGPDDSDCINNPENENELTVNENHEAENEEDHDLLWRIECLDDGKEFDIENEETMSRKITDDTGVNSSVTADEVESNFQSSNLVQLMKTESEAEKAMSQRIRVRSHKKWSKELSSLYRKQEFSAHKGSILTMKFSVDGQYLATGGEDGALNVWKVVEDERLTDFDLFSYSPVSANLNFSVNGIPNLACFLKYKEDPKAMNKLKKSLDSDGIMIPRKVFQILEKPFNEFHGHEGEILDISWSKNGVSMTCSNSTRMVLNF